MENENGKKMKNAMQLLPIWLITKATDKCQTIEEVRELNEEIRSYLDKLNGEIVEMNLANSLGLFNGLRKKMDKKDLPDQETDTNTKQIKTDRCNINRDLDYIKGYQRAFIKLTIDLLDKMKEGLSDKEREDYSDLIEMYRNAADDAVFVAYNRLYLGLLIKTDEALAEGKIDLADSFVKELIEDTRKNIKA